MTSNTISEQVRDLKWKLCSRDTENNWHTTPDKNEMYTGVSVECGDYLKVSSSCLWSAIKFGGGGRKGEGGGERGKGVGAGGVFELLIFPYKGSPTRKLTEAQG